MNLREHAMNLAAQRGCPLDWQAVVEAAADDPEEVIEAIDAAATVAARDLIRRALEDAAVDLRNKLTKFALDEGVEDVAENLIRVCAAYRAAGEELAEGLDRFTTTARRIGGTA